MKFKITLFLAVCASFLTANTFAQVNVNPLTGSANVVIPVWNFNRGQVSFPVNLVYSGNGVHLKDVEGTGGIGWNLQAGGQISRALRGLPDDCDGTGLLGWMNTSNTANTYISSIDDNLGNCTNETADLTTISSHFPYTTDTEPDIFYVNAPGLSCQLVYDKSLPGFRSLSYQDLKISYTLSGNDIASFTITNDKGIQYVFSNPDRSTMTTPGSAAPAYFKTKYLQYHNGVGFNDNWHLTTETDANGNGVILSYTTGHGRASTDSVALYIAGSGTAALQYYVKQTTTPKTLSTVSVSDGDVISTELTFTWTYSALSGGGSDQNYISSITGMGKSLNFAYSPVKYVTAGGANYYRQFLRTFIDGTDPNSPTSYSFTYYGETLTSGNYTTTLPDSSSKKVDYWGYYGSNANTALLPRVWVNPSNSSYPRYLIYQSATGGTNYPYSLTGNNMSVDAANIVTGALKTVNTIQGAVTTITYEPNDYADPQSGVVNAGSGIRVKQLEVAPGFGSPSTITTYSYLDPTSGASSGKPVSLPQFAFTIPYGGTATGAALWANATALSTADLSNEDHTVMYGYCKQSRPNGGVTQYQYYVPATNWDTGAHAGCDACTATEWLPTTDMIARHNCASTYGPVANLTSSYPFIPNPNYDFERGLLQKVTTYLDGGTTKVSETTYTYQRSFTPSSISGFRSDDITSGTLVITGYNKYNIYYGASELSKAAISTVYDSPTYSVAQTSTTNYTFGSAYHKLLTQQDAINSDGSTLTTKMTYTKDYPSAGSGTNANVTAIYNLNQLNVNTPVETIQQVTKGGTTNIIGGSLTLFKASLSISTYNYLPWQQLQFSQPNGLLSTSFTPFGATGSGGSQSVSQDSHYFPVANFTNYDYAGYLLTADDNNHHIITHTTDHNIYKSNLVAKNVAYNELAYMDFGYTVYIAPFNILGMGGSIITNGGHTGNGYAFATAQTATTTISKNALAQKYIFSIWINASAGIKTLNLSLNGGTPVAYTYTGTGAWKYYEWPISVSAMPSSFSFAFTSAQAVSIDDILFYPNTAEVTTFSYDNMSHAKTSQTDTNGISTYYLNDTWGRVLYVLDQDHNIIQRNTYVIPTGFN